MSEMSQKTPLVGEALEILSRDPELDRQYQVILPAEVCLEMYKRLRVFDLAMNIGEALTDAGVVKQSVAQDARSMYQESVQREVYERLRVAAIEDGKIRVSFSFREIDFLGRERIRLVRLMIFRKSDVSRETILSHAEKMRDVFGSASESLRLAGGRSNIGLIEEFDRLVEDLAA